MKPYSTFRSPITLAASCGLVLVLCLMAFHARADVWDKKTVLTVDQPIQVQETYLDAGTYVFKLMSSSSDRHIVQIFNKDENRIINTILAIPNYRLEPTGDSRFAFYETPSGSVKALHAWFYPGDNFGQEFRYPKHLRQIAMTTTSAETTRSAETTTELNETPPEPPPPPVVTQPAEPEPEAQVAPPVKEEQVEIAQNTPPPAPPEPVKSEEPKELPKTGTPFPIIGLGGLLSLAGYGLLRLRNSR